MSTTGEDVIISTETPAESRGMSLVSDALAIIGFVLLAVVLIWGVYNIVKISKFSLSGLFLSPASISVSGSANEVSGQPVTISWKNSSNAGGSYAFLYQCEENFSFATAGQTGVLNRVPCGTSISVGSSTSATMIPIVSSVGAASVPVSVVFTPSSSSAKITGAATLSIAPGATPAQVTNPATSAATPTKTTPVATAPATHAQTGNGPLVAHTASGPADLSVTMIATGYIDPASGALLMNRPPQPGDVVGVEFDIANIGGSTSGAYSFQAHLPTATGYTYTSASQMSLAPGQHVVSTLRFTQLVPGGMFTVVADPSSQVNDANRANNEAAVTIQ